MKLSSERVSPVTRGAAIGFAALFLLFLSLSQPHRVHHFFERYSHSDDTPEVDSENHDHGEDQTKPVQSNCALQSVAQNCQLGQIDLVKLPFTESVVESFHPPSAPWVDSFAFLPFLQRAPPSVTLLS
jgi:hypothetical protein